MIIFVDCTKKFEKYSLFDEVGTVSNYMYLGMADFLRFTVVSHVFKQVVQFGGGG